MHPAPSVILFSTLSGAGFGLLFFLGLGWPAPLGLTAFLWFGLGYALAVGGLISSTLHLGHPERAWRAFSQWRSSWLSREGVAAVAGLILMAPAVLAQMAGTRLPWIAIPAGVICLATVLTTAMIYAQLRTVPRWHHWSTPPLFLALALAGGAMLAGHNRTAAALLAVAALLQLWWWQDGDRRFGRAAVTLGSATGLGPAATVRSLAPPHTGPNYLTTEMVHVIGRRHSGRLRVIALTLGYALPLALMLAPAHPAPTALAALSHLTGVLASRWLFFAEAEHVVGLYYGGAGGVRP
jgi:DMSO reductase anchor subunit